MSGYDRALLAIALSLLVFGGAGQAQTVSHAESEPSTVGSTGPAPETVIQSTQSGSGEIKIDADRSTLDRLLGEAAGLQATYRNFRVGKSRERPSLSAFRSMELRLDALHSSDPQARDMVNSMRMIQGEMLGRSIAIANIADRKLYADEMAQRMKEGGTTVSIGGRNNSMLRVSSAAMSRQRAFELGQSANIFERAKILQFRSVVFTDGRRKLFTYNVENDRLR